jgi:hypothetical protein
VVNKKLRLNENQLAVLKCTAHHVGGWCYAQPGAGPTITGLKRRGLICTKLNNWGSLQIKITLTGLDALVAYGESPAPRKPLKEYEFADYEVRDGRDGRVGIYLREFNVRLAMFAANTHSLQVALGKLFNQHHAKQRERA